MRHPQGMHRRRQRRADHAPMGSASLQRVGVLFFIYRLTKRQFGLTIETVLTKRSELMRYNLQNTAGQYFCSTRDSLAYEWVSADALAARGYDGLVIYTEKRHAEQDILQARSPKTVKVGNRAMVRPDFPDMTGACQSQSPKSIWLMQKPITQRLVDNSAVWLYYRQCSD